MSLHWPGPYESFAARESDITAALSRVVHSGWYILGPEVEAFESEFAAYVGTDDAVGVGSGTDALVIALRALGLGPGARVATVSHTAVATVAAIELAGAVPVLVDIEEESMTMSPSSLRRTLGRHGPVDAVIPVHLYGHPVAMDEIISIAREIGAKVVEDGSQAHGSRWLGRNVGTWGDAAAFSCYPTKNLGAFGDAGVLVASHPVSEYARCLRQYGWRERYVSEVAGFNSRLDPLQAAVLRSKLPHLDDDNDRRRAVAARYDEALAGHVLAPAVARGADHVFHQFVIRSDQRDRIAATMRDRGIPVAILYPKAVHQQPAYAGRLACDPEGLPVTESVVSRLLCLPMHPQLTDDHVAQVCEAVVAGAHG